MRLEGFRFELGMKLHADKPRVIGEFDDFRQHAVGRHSGKPQSGRFERLFIADINLIAMAMPLADTGGAVDLCHPAFGGEHRFVGAQPHGSAEISLGLAPLQSVAAHPFGHQPDYWMYTRTKFGGSRIGEVREVPRSLYHRHLHAKADPEIGKPTFTSKARR